MFVILRVGDRLHEGRKSVQSGLRSKTLSSGDKRSKNLMSWSELPETTR